MKQLFNDNDEYDKWKKNYVYDILQRYCLSYYQEESSKEIAIVLSPSSYFNRQSPKLKVRHFWLYNTVFVKQTKIKVTNEN